MKDILTLAAIRMDAAPAPTESRLERAEILVAQAAAQGAQIAVLPEVFNTGYEYHPRNYSLAETLDGQTAAWMRESTRRHNLYLAGSLLLRDNTDIYNAMLLVAPNGKLWRYDKSYPWLWERAYFHPRRHPLAPAETDFGKVGLLICWDVAHPSLWAAYAGKVDLMLVSSCPPLAHAAPLCFPDGKKVLPAELGPLMKHIYHNGGKVFGEYLRQQTAWLGVPLVHTTGAGQFRSFLPRPRLSLGILLAARPDLWGYVSQAEKVFIESGFFNETFIADASGRVLSRASQDSDNLTVSKLNLPTETPKPRTKQPKIGLSALTYQADALTNRLLSGYDKHHRKS
jgi:predicted amidohydrolase